jgi:hypothetical protein
VSNKCDSPLFIRVLSLFSTDFHGILRPWISLRFRTSINSIAKH